MFPHYTAQNLLFAELLHKFVYTQGPFYILISLLCPIILWLIARKLFNKRFALIPPIVLLLSPWAWYLTLAHSFYIFLFFLTLIIIYGIVLIRSGYKIAGNILTTLGSVISIYSSSIFIALIPIGFILLIFLKIINLKQLKYSIFVLILLILPLVIFINKNTVGFKNTFSRNVRIFSDPSLLNSVNRFQGAAGEIGLKNLSRISENKYIFFTEYSLLKYTTQLVPKTFFTPEYKLLGFSFSPPIFIGFVIPFIYGLYLALKKAELRNILFVSTLLTIPSILANEQVALNRLILFSPVIFILISYGLINFYEERKKNVARNFLALTIFLVIFQLFVTINDIRFRESQRFVQYFGNKYEITEP